MGLLRKARLFPKVAYCRPVRVVWPQCEVRRGLDGVEDFLVVFAVNRYFECFGGVAFDNPAIHEKTSPLQLYVLCPIGRFYYGCILRRSCRGAG